MEDKNRLRGNSKLDRGYLGEMENAVYILQMVPVYLRTNCGSQNDGLAKWLAYWPLYAITPL